MISFLYITASTFKMLYIDSLIYDQFCLYDCMHSVSPDLTLLLTPPFKYLSFNYEATERLYCSDKQSKKSVNCQTEIMQHKE